MKIVITILVAVLVVGCVAVHFSNAYFGTNNVPRSLSEFYTSLESLGSFGDIFKGTMKDLEELLVDLNKYDLGEFPDFSDGITWQEIVDVVLSYNLEVKISVITWHVIVSMWSVTLDTFVYVFNVLSLVSKLIFGVPRPSTLMFAIS